MSTGLPGARLIMKKLSMVTPKSTGMAIKMRRKMY
jgi:hypothetical protein